MRPTLRQLEYIIAIAETEQIDLAAAKFNVSQPSLSAQLAEILVDALRDGAKTLIQEL